MISVDKEDASLFTHTQVSISSFGNFLKAGNPLCEVRHLFTDGYLIERCILHSLANEQPVLFSRSNVVLKTTIGGAKTFSFGAKVVRMVSTHLQEELNVLTKK